MNTDNKAVLFARSNNGATAIREQVKLLRDYAAANEIKVVGQVTLPHCSANDYEVEANLTALLGRRRGRSNFGMIIITDLSRLSRRGITHGMHLIKRLSDAGVSVVTPDLGVVTDVLWNSFPRLNRGWARTRRRNSNLNRKEPIPRDSKDPDVEHLHPDDAGRRTETLRSRPEALPARPRSSGGRAAKEGKQ
jgi:hypothetical protein